MSGQVLTPEKRAAMNALYRLLRDRTGCWRGAIKAYVLATATGEDPAEACARASFGVGLAELGPGGVQAIRDWVARFDRVANSVRQREHLENIAAPR